MSFPVLERRKETVMRGLFLGIEGDPAVNFSAERAGSLTYMIFTVRSLRTGDMRARGCVLAERKVVIEPFANQLLKAGGVLRDGGRFQEGSKFAKEVNERVQRIGRRRNRSGCCRNGRGRERSGRGRNGTRDGFRRCGGVNRVQKPLVRMREGVVDPRVWTTGSKTR